MRWSSQRRYAPAWATGALLVAATLAFALGEDNGKRTVTEPRADALYYYAYVPSIVLDRDLDFTNQYRVTHNWYHLGTTPTGRPSNVFGIGPAIFEIPAFIVGHGLAIVSGSRRDGFSQFETALCMWTSIAFTAGAFFVAFRMCRRRLGAGLHAYLGPLLALVSGPVLYYAIRQPGYGHPSATLFATWLIERWDASFDAARPRSVRTWIVLGALAGAAVLARPQLIVWVSVLVLAVVDDVRMRGSVPTWRLASRWLAAAAIATLIFLPQVIAWKVLYGAWFTVPQGSGFMRWDHPAWSEVLFSSRNGLFPWAPLYAPMLIGTLSLFRRMPRVVASLILGFVGQVLANGAAWDWWAGGSFGGRRFDSTYLVFAFGAAAGLRWAFDNVVLRGAPRSWRYWRYVRTAAVTAIIVATTLVALATVQLAGKTSVVSARIQGGEPASTTWLGLGGMKGRVAAWLSSASSFPARLWFALRHDAGLEDYDGVVGRYYLGETYPGLNSYSDKFHDVIEVGKPDKRITGIVSVGAGQSGVSSGRTRVFVGLNRRGGLRLHFKFQAHVEVDVDIRWNGGSISRRLIQPGKTVLDVETDSLCRGINTLEIISSGELVIGAIDLFATPSH